jgi:chromatin segregation and condensation protein Rec8/ScpA/Scc1 (kleisin family)
MENKQTTLLEFFEIVEKPAWRIMLTDIVRSKKMDVWDIDVKLLAQEYMQRIHAEKDLNQLSTAMLICSILLKYKSQRIGIKELESQIEEEIEETEEQIPEMPEHIIIENEENQISLDKLAKTAGNILGRNNMKKYERKKPEIHIPIMEENFEVTGKKILDYFSQQEKKTFYYEDLKDLGFSNNIFMTLLFLNGDDKIKLQQKEFYSDLKIKI